MKNKNEVVDDHLLLTYRLNANLRGIRIMIITTFLLFLLGGLGIDWVHAYLGGTGNAHEDQKIFWHATGTIFGLIAFFIHRFLFTRKEDKTPDKRFITGFSVYLFIVCSITMGLCTMLTLMEQLQTSNLLFYVVAIVGIIALLRIKQWMLAFILIPFTILFWVLLPKYQPNENLVVSNIIFTVVVTIAAFIANGIMENKFVKQVLQQELIKNQTNSLLESNQAKDTILSVVAHDLRTPVANIDQLIELISHETTGEAEKKKFMSLIKQSCHQAFEIIEDILEISTSNKTKLQLVPSDLCEIIRKVIDEHSNKSRQKKILIDFESDNFPVIAAVQPSKIERVIQNLVSNAIKFTPSGGKVEVSCYDNNGIANIRIKDNGIGIPEELLGHLFQPFSKARRTGIDGEKTVGLGLSIVKNIIENHHGTIEVKSHELRGTTFEINIPCFY